MCSAECVQRNVFSAKTKRSKTKTKMQKGVQKGGRAKSLFL
jgi:hypothetical protein